MPTPLEADIEEHCCRIASVRGVDNVKLNLHGRRGWPDRMFLTTHERVWFVEFKRPGEDPSELQKRVHRRLKQLGFRVSVIRTVKGFRRELRKWKV